MDCIILQNTYCACEDITQQLQTLFPQIKIVFISEEANQIVKWLQHNSDSSECIIADVEACDGNSVTIFDRAGIRNPIILTHSSLDDLMHSYDLDVAGVILKPVVSTKLEKVMTQLSRRFR